MTIAGDVGRHLPVRVGSTLSQWWPGSRSKAWVRKAAVAAWMNVLILLVLAVTGVATAGGGATWRWPAEAPHVAVCSVFAVWLLSFLPGWLYVRFLGLRAGALWNEYVLNLHRLGWDQPQFLPAPPRDSEFHRPGGESRERTGGENIYRQKFDAYYGRRVAEGAGSGTDFTVRVETLFPVFLCTTMLAVAWSAVLWAPTSLVDPSGPWSALMFGFLGAYAFGISMLVRRFYQSDLRPSAYASVILRVVLVLLIVSVLHQLFVWTGASDGQSVDELELLAAFVVGFFPLVGLQAIQRVTSKALHVFVPQLAPDYPLDQLDGLNVWYEARLVEEGVEDMQNLTTMNLVDVILHTRVPVGRLVDWVDQAFLLIHLEPADREQLRAARRATCAPQDALLRSGAATRVALRRLGVRSATDLLKTFGPDGLPRHDGDGRVTPAPVTGLDPAQIGLLVRVLDKEPALSPVWHWERHSAGHRG